LPSKSPTDGGDREGSLPTLAENGRGGGDMDDDVDGVETEDLDEVEDLGADL